QAHAAPHDLGLVVAEDLLAVELEDVGDAHAADPLDDPVGVYEGQLQPARELPADPPLARAHEAGHRKPRDNAFCREVAPARVRRHGPAPTWLTRPLISRPPVRQSLPTVLGLRPPARG